MNRQKVFDKVANHLLEQFLQSWSNEKFDCVYFSDDGLKCAIGCLIDEKIYSKNLEGNAITNKIVQKALELSGIQLRTNKLGPCINPKYQSDLSFLGELQFIHDNNSPTRWRNLLCDFAKQCGLETSNIKESSFEKWIRETFEKITKNMRDDCPDNYRVCEVGDEQGEQDYQETFNLGCCGSYDEVFTHEQSGRKFRFGFNYGH